VTRSAVPLGRFPPVVSGPAAFESAVPTNRTAIVIHAAVMR
jgi:hypothetical protein